MPRMKQVGETKLSGRHKMRRHQVEKLLKDAESNNGAQDFHISVPYSELSAALSILKHLELAGQFDSYSRRDAEGLCNSCAEGKCGCIMIYGYTG